LPLWCRSCGCMEKIAYNTSCWCLFCTEPHVRLTFAPNTIFLCNCCKKQKIIISSFNSKLGDWSTTPGPSPNQLEHTKSVGNTDPLKAIIQKTRFKRTQMFLSRGGSTVMVMFQALVPYNFLHNQSTIL
jgi:hypothetical protein